MALMMHIRRAHGKTMKDYAGTAFHTMHNAEVAAYEERRRKAHVPCEWAVFRMGLLIPNHMSTRTSNIA